MLRFLHKQVVVLVVALTMLPLSIETSFADPLKSKEPLDSKKSERKHGKHSQRDKKNADGKRRRDAFPSFRDVKKLESLTPIQEAKITNIIKLQREQSLPLMEKLRALREQSENSESAGSSESTDSRKPKRSRESTELRMKIHAIKKEAWLKMQPILTKEQKLELADRQKEPHESRRRTNADAQPTSRDSGKAFSK